ncbi:DUF2470 domain-containing protein [Marinactinospora rubrisoli]|uniref:DUF2470 domain-containing protein n=1 Tax=Marinactinospora rubrisoli TaxID=2715399 RepID=A0ABW2KMI0_9ACTN
MRQPGPSELERVRSLAATATPTTAALADDPTAHFSVRGAVDHVGRAVLLLQADSPLHSALRTARHGRPDLMVGIGLSALRHVGRTPTVRARLWCEGRVSAVPTGERREAALAVWERVPDEELLAAVDHHPTTVEGDAPLLARVEPATVLYETYDSAGVIDGTDFRDTTPDPLTSAAERIIGHVNDRHRDDLTAVLREIPAAPVGSAWLWELDRHGLTLWVAPYDQDRPVLVRLPWSGPARSTCELERALHELLTHRAPHC